MTVAEYAAWCAEIEESAAATGFASSASGLTWGEFRAWVIDAEEAYASVNPPEVLTDYHTYRTSVITVIRGVAEEKDASLIVKPEEFFDPRIVAIGLLSPVEELPSEVRQQLIDGGCISGSNSTESGESIASDSPTEVREVSVGEEFEANVNGVSITIDGFAWEEEIRASEYSVSTPAEGSKFLIVTFTIRNTGNKDFYPWDVQAAFYAEDAAGVQYHGVHVGGIKNVSEERWGVILADVARPGRTVSTLESYEIKDRASELVLRSDDFGVFMPVPERPQ